MIYDSLDKIPFKLFYHILESGDVSLLDTEDKKTVGEAISNLDYLQSIWSVLEDEHVKRKESKGGKNFFNLIKRIHLVVMKQRLILLCVDSLRTSYNQESLGILKDFKFYVNDESNESYHKDLEMIEMMANELSDTIEQLSKGLPKIEEQEEKKEDTLLEINKLLASYSLIVGYRIDPNTTTYNEVQGVEESIEAKIKATKIENNG